MFRLGRKKVSRNWKSPGSNYSKFLSFLLLSLCVFLLMECFIFLERRIRPAIVSVAEIKADFLATDAVNKAILEEVTPGVLYNDLISIKQDDGGKIILALVNTMEINRLLARTTLATQHALAHLGQDSFKIPLGEALDNYFLATYGPRIPVRFIPVGRVNTRLVDVFEEAGINQVRHKIYFDVYTEVRIIIPFMRSNVVVETTIPITDAIYPGEVPETVLNLNMDAHRLERQFP